MTPLFAKLNLTKQPGIVVLHAPDSFQPELAALTGVEVFSSLNALDGATFALVFATKKADVDRLSHALAVALKGDVIVWFAYPKGTSKRFRCDFNRDNGWDVLRHLGFDTVRQVAIDEDWSALRFRRVEFIGSR